MQILLVLIRECQDNNRVIEFPVGDMLNPVYSTLNFLTASEMFPQIENQEFPFFRPREHETKVSLVQPIFNSEIIHNYRIQKQYTEIARIDVTRYKRELINHYYALQAAYESVQSAGKQTRSALRAYELINRKYIEGQSSLLELIDARTSMTGAAANSIIAQTQYFSQLADFEYAMGANGLEKY